MNHKKAELLAGISEVERRAFYMNQELTHVVIPDGVTIIRESAFQGCRNLQSVIIPKSVVCIEALAFDCKQLRQQLRSPYSFEPVDLWVPDWSKQVTLEYAGTRAAWNKIEKSTDMGDVQITFGNGIDRDNRMTLKAYDKAVTKKRYRHSNLRTIVIPEGVTKIEKETFFWCCNLISVKIPSTVTEIGASAFAFCRNLREIQIPDSVTHIAEDAFRQCDNLREITIPSSVQKIGAGAFAHCDKLKKVVAAPETIAVKINVAAEENGCDYAHSRFMGAPLIPLSWKEKAEAGTLDIYENDAFWFQVNFAELNWMDGTALPRQGYLYVFLNLKDYPYTIRSYYYDGSEGAPSCVIDGFNEGFESYGLTQTSYPITFTCCACCEDGTKLRGIPAMGEHDGKNLFMQYDPLDSPMAFLKEIDGYGYIFMKEGGLADMEFVIERT